eukprot:15054782-Ditylum_brightwellii.AAC.1
MNQYASFSPNDTLCQPEKDLDKLLLRCKNILPMFKQKLTKITKAAGLDPDKVATWQGKEIMLTSDT